MKRAIIVRHAKAVAYGYRDDFNRDLSDRGKNDAQRIGDELKNMGIVAGAMVSSPAKRTLKTAQVFASKLGFNEKEINQMQEIYDGMTTSEFLEMINNFPDSAETVFIFGHNPGFYYFVDNLVSTAGDDMPTCSTFAIDFDVDSWKKVEARTGKKAFQLIPKMFR